MKFNFGASALFVVVGLLHAGLTHACPQPHADRKISNNDVSQFVKESEYLSGGDEKNKLIEKCFNERKEQLSWNQVKILLSALVDLDLIHQSDDDQVQDRIIESYFSLNASKFSPEFAIELASMKWSGSDRNRLIEQFYEIHKKTITFSSLETLLKGLIDLRLFNHSLDDDEIEDRIWESYLNLRLKKLKPSEAVQVAKKQSSGYHTNRLIEGYFEANKTTLTWDHVKTLLDGLVDIGLDNKYDDDETQDRIIHAWTEC